MNESVIVGVILFIFGGLAVVRPDLWVGWRVWLSRVLLGARFVPSERTYRVQRIIGALFIIVGLLAITGRLG